ncbi:TolB family protein [Fibrella forsythiae]|uniref:Uncharacterized protein n=1 Tax=Fibrella forsythiae TaxID=2817061 RepID=A0ABS3JJY5_9BACT|nr:LpqB family beta-propeller domain-containing protein [Fibrella forsythiae]MBO0950320.1 hypothetical protein [Fibrella forsythiae]
MKKVLPLALLVLLGISCKHQPDPDPANTFAMAAWIDYGTSPLSVKLRGSVFPSTAGPVETPFDKAEVYISDNISGGYQLIGTTSQTSYSLTTLQPGTSYYIQVKGALAGHTADSKPVLLVNDVVVPTRKLMSYDPQAMYYVSSTGLPVIEQKADYTNISRILTTSVIDATGTKQVAAYTAPTTSQPLFRGWSSTNQRAFFEITRSAKRALISYDLATNAYADVPLPAEAELWNYAIAPDGQQIVFTDYKRPGLWYFDARTNTQKQLDSQPTVYDLSWTPDSRYIWLTAPGNGGTGVNQYDPATATKTSVFSERSTLSGAQLSPDGKWVLYRNDASGRDILWLRNTATGGKRPVGVVNQYGWLNNGTFWAGYSTNDTKTPTERESFLWVFTP